MEYANVIEALKKQTSGYYADRALAELEYAGRLSAVRGGQFDELVGQAAAFLRSAFERSGALTKKDCVRAEELLSPLASLAKSYGMRFVGHGHIDMNWMWSYPETVEIVLETTRTMVRLMEEYPSFTYAQSQASVYRILEEYDPELLRKVKRFIKKGQWEVTAATWVEGDKNMSSPEAQARQLLYTKKYLSRLLSLEDKDFLLDFEPDTFGHSENVPEILSAAGVKYYYHCRAFGHDDAIYRWQAPSGAELLVNREVLWYGIWKVDPYLAMWAPELCEKYHIPFSLHVYGVGDHGGGPTRRDVERILDMATWPIFPDIRFGSYREYYAELEKVRDSLPLYREEINPQFSGCYTSQSRIKAFNKIGEQRLAEAEGLGALTSVLSPSYKPVPLDEAWINVLFNQFHDILPGSGVIETREYSSALFQKALADANTAMGRAMRELSSKIDTSSLPAEYAPVSPPPQGYTRDMSEGAGTGFGVTQYGSPQAERGRGVNRVLHFFNPSALPFSGVTEFPLWDWPGEPANLQITDPDGRPVASELLPGDNGGSASHYWGHSYHRVAAEVSVPAYGYATLALGEKAPERKSSIPSAHDVPEKPHSYVLENDELRAVFCPVSFAVLSLTDKKTGRELADRARPFGVFRVVTEDNNGMEAWRVGKYAEVGGGNPRTRVLSYRPLSGLRGELSYSVRLTDRSSLRVTVCLDKGAAALRYDVKAVWLEAGGPEYLPSLGVSFPFAYNCGRYDYAVPMGILSRDGVAQDLPALGFVAAPGAERPLYVASSSKYGFRCENNSVSLNLLRSSTNPDPYPELGEHAFSLSVGLAPSAKPSDLEETAYRYANKPCYASGSAHAGSLPPSGSALAVEGGHVTVTAFKPSEDGKGFLLRLYENEGRDATLTLAFARPVSSARPVDLHERPIGGAFLPVENGRVMVEAKALSLTSLYVVLTEE